jgi:hypothetical protein
LQFSKKHLARAPGRRVVINLQVPGSYLKIQILPASQYGRIQLARK